MATWLFALTTIALLMNGLRLRHRARRLQELIPSASAVDPEHDFITAESVRLDPSIRRAASRFAQDEGLDVVELVPFDLPLERALDLLRYIDPHTFRREPLARHVGSGHALLATRDVLERARVATRSELDPVAFLRTTSPLKRFATSTTDLAVAAFSASGGYYTKRYAWLQEAFLPEMFIDAAPLVVMVELAECGLLMAGLLSGSVWGLAAFAAYHVQPLLVFAGSPLKPRDLAWRPWLRLAARIVDVMRTIAGRWRPVVEQDPVEALRADYEARLVGGCARFLEPRRMDCPLCGSVELSVRMKTPDFLQAKPGQFTLEECMSCGHIFQNPRLTLEGLEFYYKDFWEGLCSGLTGFALDQGKIAYQARAAMLRGIAEPKRWLDVGGGHGHFGLFAREVWPHARFDGLDLSESIEQAERQHWIDKAHRGLFPELAPSLAGQYDVVSMHHYLEHTRDPRAELAAAARVLPPGGHLLIEVPDPEYVLGRVLGRWWAPWAQPQHQHFVSVANLERLLSEHGFARVALHRGSAHIPDDMIFLVYFALQRVAPPSRVPWRPRASLAARLWRKLAIVAFLPLLVLAASVDALSAALLRSAKRSNTYRLLARRLDDTAR